MTPEKAIQNQIISFLRFNKVFCWQNDSVGIFDQRKNLFRKNRGRFKINGVSDILGVFHGRFLAIEVKSKVGKLTDDQRAFIENVKDHGGIAFVARSIEDVMTVLGPLPHVGNGR